ncbi:MAG: hypothetical protein ACKOAD_08110 [Gammaproteobacteria bacterium]
MDSKKNEIADTNADTDSDSDSLDQLFSDLGLTKSFTPIAPVYEMKKSAHQSTPLIEIKFPEVYKIAIIDLDDTLIATSELKLLAPEPTTFTAQSSNSTTSYLNLSKIEDYSDLLAKVQDTIINLFKNLEKKFDKVFLISNADSLWMQIALNFFLPNLENLINTSPTMYKISALEFYKNKYPDQFNKSIYTEWKKEIFEYVINTEIPGLNNLDTKKHIFIAGDNTTDQEAALHIHNKNYKKTFTKFMKFKTLPKLQDIHEQITSLIHHLEQIIYMERSFIFISDLEQKRIDAEKVFSESASSSATTKI